jgi:small subunit ribosomal protein S1
VQKGQEVKVMVLDVDAENKRISLGLKQLQDDPWPQISERFAPGVESPGKVARVQDKGVVVDLGDDIEGFLPASHSGVEDASKLGEYYEAGDPLDLRVLESDATNRRIVLEVTSKPKRKPGKPQATEGAAPAEGASTAEVASETAAVRSGELPESRASSDVQEAAAAVREQADSEEQRSGPVGADKNQ